MQPTYRKPYQVGRNHAEALTNEDGNHVTIEVRPAIQDTSEYVSHKTPEILTNWVPREAKAEFQAIGGVLRQHSALAAPAFD